MTPRQSTALKFIKGYIKLRGYAPSVREVAAHMNTNTSNAHRIVAKLEEGGHIRRTKGRVRSIEVVA